MPRHATVEARRTAGRPGLTAAVALAWLPTVALLVLGLLPRSPAAGAAVTVLFALWYAVLARRRLPRLSDEPWRAAPLLVFLAPLGLLLGLLRERAAGGSPIVLGDFAAALAAVGAAHVVLLLLERVDESNRPRLIVRLLVAWLALVWLGSTAQQLVRFRLFQPTGHPEDTAFLYDCFRSWAAGGPLLSPWAAAWGHGALRSYLGLHFSPIVVPVFAVARLWPRVGTLLVLQNLFLAAGLVLWARVLARQARRGRSATGTPVALWFLALLVASPPLGAALRNELHPLLWALPALAWLHGAYLRRARGRFVLAALSLFLFREDLGLVLAAYAPLAWLEGRRGRGDRFWLVAPLLGLPLAAWLMLGVMPRYGTPDAAFFHRVFATAATGIVPLLLGLLAQPGELLARLLRPGHLLLLLRLGATGTGVPWRSWLWVLGVPLVVLFALVGRDMQLLRLDSHYAAVPALFLVGGGLVSLWGWLREIHPRRRDVACVVLWALAAAQPARLLLLDRDALRHAARVRAEVLSDLRALDLTDRAWVPVELMIGAPAARAVPAHRLVLEGLDATRPGLPGWALLPTGPTGATEAGRLLARHYRLAGPVTTGLRYDLYRLEAQAGR